MRLKLGCQIFLYGLVLLFSASKVTPGVVLINRCCGTNQVYDAVHDECKPAAKGDSKITADYSTELDQVAYDPKSVNEFALSKAFVQVLDRKNESNQVEFMMHHHLPNSTCTKGMFLKSFCMRENQSDCTNGTERLSLTTRGELKVGDEYYSPLEYCVTRIQENTIDFRICNPTCTAEVPCVRKCCERQEVWNFNRGGRMGCVYSNTSSWEPRFYSTAKSPLKSGTHVSVHPHYFISHPRYWCKERQNAVFLQQRDEATGKLNWLFRVGINQNIFRRSTRYSWIEYKDIWNYYCMDGSVNSKHLPADEVDVFEGLEEEDMYVECIPSGVRPAVKKSNWQLGLYTFGMTTSCLFLFATLVVYLLLWKRQKVHGWTLMSYCLNLFFMFLLHVWKYIYAMGARGSDKVEPLCAFIGVAINYFFISTFCWLTMINFDLWWTFRTLKVISKSDRGLKRYLAYATVAVLVPTVFVVTGIAMDMTYGLDPESGAIVPEYGRKQCGLEPEYAKWTYQNGPAGIFLLFNIVFFSLTAYSIYKAQEGAKFASSSSSRQTDTKARAILFGKLLIVTGIPFVFEFISSLAEGTNYADVAWYWAIFDMINFFQGVYIFIIFVIKKEVRRNLAEDHFFCRCFLAHLPSVHESDRAGQKASPTGASTSEEATGSTGFDSSEKTSGL